MRFEHWFYTLPLGVRSIVRRRQRDREVEDRVAGGWTATKHRCGPARVRRAREQCRDAGGVNAIDSVMKDLRYAARVLRRNRAFTVVAVLTLALAALTIAQIARAVLLAITAGLLVRSLWTLSRRDLGFSPDQGAAPWAWTR